MSQCTEDQALEKTAHTDTHAHNISSPKTSVEELDVVIPDPRMKKGVSGSVSYYVGRYVSMCLWSLCDHCS